MSWISILLQGTVKTLKNTIKTKEFWYVAHGYVKVKNEIIWDIIERDIPLLKKEIGEKADLF